MVALRKAPEAAPTGPAEKRCSRCSKRFIGNAPRCDRCHEYECNRAVRTRAELRAEGICTTCRKMDADPGENTCESCKERSRRLCANERANAVAAGLCQRCHVTKPRDGGVTCKGCLLDRRLKWARAKRRLRASNAVLLAFADHDELDLKALANVARMSTRQVLRHLRKLIPAGAVTVAEVKSEGPAHKNVYSRSRGVRLVIP